MAAGTDRRFGLEYLSVFGMALPDYVALAARLGCDFVSVNFSGPANALELGERETLKESAPLRRRLSDALVEHGLSLEMVEGFAIRPNGTVADEAGALDAVAHLGARSICAVSIDKDRNRTIDQFAELASMGAARGISVTAEVGPGAMREFPTACAIWEAVAHDNFALLIDTMHYFRKGGGVGDLESVAPHAIGHVQLCDVAMPGSRETYMEEALYERRCPGDGDLPLGPFLAAIPATVPVGLEIPVRSAIDAGQGFAEVLGRCLQKAKALAA